MYRRGNCKIQSTTNLVRRKTRTETTSVCNVYNNQNPTQPPKAGAMTPVSIVLYSQLRTVNLLCFDLNWTLTVTVTNGQQQHLPLL